MTGMVTLLHRPSTPSVRFTALTQPTITNMAKKMYTSGCSRKLVFTKGMYRSVCILPVRYMAYRNRAETAICSMAF